MFVKVHFYKKAKKYNKNMLTAKSEKCLFVCFLNWDLILQIFAPILNN